LLDVHQGENDELFCADKARPILDEISDFYRKLHRSEYFESRVFDGGHEFSWADESLEFLARHLDP